MTDLTKPDRLQPDISTVRSLEEERQRSENLTAGTPLSYEESQRLIHQLQVHQIELEMQNEELMQARLEREKIEAQLGTYSELYDFAPVGYFNLDREGIILTTNFTGAGFLGIERSSLTGRHLDFFISNETRPVFHDFLDRVFTSEVKETCEIVILKESYSPRVVQVEALVSASGRECRVVIIDLTESKKADEELRKSTAKYKEANAKLLDSRHATINMMQDAIIARHQAEALSLKLQREVAERMRAEIALLKAHEELEQRVNERTSDLASTVNALLAEIDVREKAEEALEKSANELSDLYNHAPCGYHSLDKDGTFVRINDTELRWLGYERDEVIGKLKVSDIQTPGSLAVFTKNFPMFKHANALNDLRLSFIRKDGSILPVLLNASPIFDDNGEYLMSRSTIYDITDLTRAEESIQRLNRLYLTLSETGKAIAHIPDRDTLFREICRIAAEHGGFILSWIGLFDEETGEVRKIAAYGITDYLDDIRVTANTEPAGEGPTGLSIRSGTYYICNDFQNDPCTRPWHEQGKAHEIFSSASIALKDGEKVIGALTLYAGEMNFFDEKLVALLVQMQVDISFALENLAREKQRKIIEQSLHAEIETKLRAVEALREKEQMLIQQSRQAAMGEMIGNIAHQWRQPLNSLGLSVQQLLLFYDLGEFNREFLDRSVTQSMTLIKHMSETIEDFRNYFKPDKEMTEFRVRAAIEHTLSLIDDSFKTQHINCEFVIKDDVVIYGFQNEFAQALLNILNNARDILTEREIDAPRVTISIFNQDGAAVVTIADNAGGILEEIMDKIFDPYFTTKGPQQGTGVGLFMSKAIIEKNMGGKLSVLNTDTGAEFRIEVPNGIEN